MASARDSKSLRLSGISNVVERKNQNSSRMLRNEDILPSDAVASYTYRLHEASLLFDGKKDNPLLFRTISSGKEQGAQIGGTRPKSGMPHHSSSLGSSPLGSVASVGSVRGPTINGQFIWQSSGTI